MKIYLSIFIAILAISTIFAGGALLGGSLLKGDKLKNSAIISALQLPEGSQIEFKSEEMLCYETYCICTIHFGNIETYHFWTLRHHNDGSYKTSEELTEERNEYIQKQYERFYNYISSNSKPEVEVNGGDIIIG